MAENKKSFVLYTDLIHTIEHLEEDEAGRLFKHLMAYVNDLNPEAPDKLTKVLFEPIKRQLKRDLVKYEHKKEHWSEAGKASAEARRLAKEAENQNNGSTESTNVDKRSECSTNSTVNVNDTVNVTVTDTAIKKKELYLIFETFRQRYPGTKRGNETELENLKKKHRDWEDIIHVLPDVIEKQKAHREMLRSINAFIPEWKNLQTWINQRCWEEVLPEPAMQPLKAVRDDSW